MVYNSQQGLIGVYQTPVAADWPIPGRKVVDLRLFEHKGSPLTAEIALSGLLPLGRISDLQLNRRVSLLGIRWQLAAHQTMRPASGEFITVLQLEALPLPGTAISKPRPDKTKSTPAAPTTNELEPVA